MLNTSRLIESFNQIVGWPYRSPGTNNQNGIDCSGAFVRAYRIQNASIYHGSNRIMRVYCRRQTPIASWGDLALAMPLFKARKDLSNLTAQYKPGGKYYNPSLPDDYYHIGLITSLEPLTVTHATTPAARRDSYPRRSGESDAAYHARAVSAIKARGWTWAAYLNDVSYEGGTPEPIPEPIPQPGTGDKTVVVSASSVNMRKTPAGTYMLRIPGGTTLKITEETTQNGILYGKTSYKGYTGWVDETYVTARDGVLRSRRAEEEGNGEETVLDEIVLEKLSKDMAYTLYEALATALNEGQENG